MQTKIRGIRTGGSGEEIDLKCSRDGDLRIAQYLPPYAMLAAAGKIFAFDSSAGTAKAPVIAVPTTTATWSLYNSAAGGGTSLVILKVAMVTAEGVTGLGGAIIGTVAVSEQTAETAKYTSSIVSCMDGSAKQPNAFLANATTLIGTQSVWMVLAAGTVAAGTYVGQGLVADVAGMMVVPPHGCAAFDFVSPAGSSPLYDIHILAAQVQLDTA